MAQSNSGRSGGAKKPTSTARNSGTAKSNTASRSRSAGSSKSGTTKNTSNRSRSSVGSRGRAPAHNAPPVKPMRREAGAMALLFLGIVAVIALFPSEGWLVEGWRSLIGGLFGWGYYIAAAALLWGAYVLGFHRGRPVRLRVTCVLLLPLVFGAFVHALWNDYDGAKISHLWLSGIDLVEHCGGVLAGLIGYVLRKALSRVGAFILLVAAFLLMLIEGMNLSLPAIMDMIVKWFRERPKLDYEPEDKQPDEDEPIEEADRLNPEDYLFPLDGSSPIRRPKERNAKRKPAPEAPKPAEQPVVRRRMYDEAWEERKDRIFEAMGIDDGARMRVASALRDEQRASKERRTAEAAARHVAGKDKPVVAAEKTPESTAKTTAKKEPAKPEPTKEVEPIALEDAARIAGVELNSADMDAGAAAPASEKKEKIDKEAEAALVAQEIAEGEAEDKPEYIFPSLELLNRSQAGSGADMSDLEDSEARLETAIRSYGVGASITGAIRGPSITRYELKLDQGVKLNKITNLAGDIALSLGVSGVRIAPIPNKISTVGVEVPNRVKQTVWLGDVVDSDEFRSAKSKLSVSLGKDISGHVVIGNIAKMPHVLIAGTTGSGKSVCINSIILSLLYKSTPDEVRMIMIDPKMVELGIYNGMPHLYVPVVTDAKKAAGALQWSVVEMLKRYRLFSEVGVRDLTGYNAVLAQNDQSTLPQVVIIIDELADLMMVASKEVEESICRVAQMGRAAGMHLIVATQRPSADVITGLMKANIPSRIAFAVASSLESRIILDQQGAEALVGSGDMLYSPIGKKPIRVQGAFVSDEEREEIINFVKKQAEAEYSDEILAEIEKASADKNDKAGAEKDDAAPQNDYDELLPQAVEVIFETKQASVSMLQRRLKLGYSRAARLIDQLEEIGVVGAYAGSKPREILLTKQQWQEMQYAQGTAPVDAIVEDSLSAQFNEIASGDEFGSPAEEPDTEEETVEEETEPADDVPWEEDEP